MRMTYIIK